MNEKDLLDAIGEIKDELIEKTALPDTSGVDTEPAGEEHFIMENKMNNETKAQKNSFFIRPAVAAAVAGLVLLGNVALFAGIAKMRGVNVGFTRAAASRAEADQPTMPDLIGMDYSEAVLMCGDKLNIMVDSREYSDYEAERIFMQDIPAGDPVSAGDTVHVRVSLGVKMVCLPDVTGWTFDVASNTILQEGLFIDKRSEYSNEVEKGLVISQDPPGDTDLEPGSYVQLTVSLGAKPTMVKVADLTGLTWENAETWAKDADLIAKKVEVPDDSEAGTVLGQDIAPNEEVAAGTAITLRVSAGKADDAEDTAEKEVRITFALPEKAAGRFSIVQYENGELTAASSVVDPATADGSASIAVKGTGQAEVILHLRNENTGADVQIGTYRVDFGKCTYEAVSADVDAAFAAAGLLAG